MSESAPLTREIALRLALAVRELQPVLDLRAFVGLLSERLGLPLTATKLSGVTVADLALWLQDADGRPAALDKDAFKNAVRFLWGEGVDDGLPKARPYADGDIPNSLRVAMASNQGELVDGHFGSCQRFLVYQVGIADSRLVAVRETRDADAEEDKNVARARLIDDCQLVYVQSIGGPAAAKVVRAGVHPVKWPAAGPTEVAIAKLQTAMLAPPPWLARVMGVEAASLARFADELEESDA